MNGRRGQEVTHGYNAPVRILLTRLSALGDIVHTWPLADAIGASGEHRLAWLVEAPFAPLVAGHPAVSRVITVATKRWRRRPLAPATWREMVAARHAIASFAPDLALDPQGLWKSALWAAWARVGRRIGLAASARRERISGVFYTEVVEPSETCRHVVDINLALLAPLGVVPPRKALPDGRFMVPGAPRPAWLPPRAVCLLPTTGGHGKAWPLANVASLAARLVAHGLPVVVLWGPGEEGAARTVADAAPGTVVAPPTTIQELAVALHHSGVVVGGDTGPVHLAAALGTPTVAIMVATDPQRNGVRGLRAVSLAGADSGARRGRARTRPVRSLAVEEVLATTLALATQPGPGALP